MSSMHDIIMKVFEDCNLMLDEQSFSQEELLRTYAMFLSKSAVIEKHNVNVVLHTGSILFDCVAIIYAAISNLLLNDTGGEDIISSLEVGDSVLYGIKKKERYIFEGFTVVDQFPDKEYILLTQGNSTRISVPKLQWRHISPYMGKATKLDGRGIRNSNHIREVFLKEVLGVADQDISTIVDTSTVIVISKERADKIINGISIQFENKEVRLLDLITASYFTTNDEHYYGGNSGKIEPVLKLTGKISVARKLLLNRNGNKNIGLMVLGNEMVTKGITELQELWNRQSIKYIFTSVHIDSEHGEFLLNAYEKTNLFACTKDFLVSKSEPSRTQNELTMELSQQIKVIVERELQTITLKGIFSWEDYRDFKKSMHAIKNSELDDAEKESFILGAYSLMNIFQSAVFKVSLLEQMIATNKLQLICPAHKLRTLQENTFLFPNYIKEKVDHIVDMLETAYLKISEESEKEDELRRLLRENHDKQIAVVVPKAYYATIMRESEIHSLMDTEKLLHITTANRFDNTQIYDLVICVNDVSGKKFNPFRCRSSQKIIALLYECELMLFNYKMKKENRLEKIYNFHKKDMDVEEFGLSELFYDHDENTNEIEMMQSISTEVDEYISYLNEMSDLRTLGIPITATNSMTETVAVISFETGEKAFFTKMYKGYVFDEDNGEVIETAIDDLCEGDSIIFTQNNAETRDIVDSLLSKLIQSNKLSSDNIECYFKSKRWKKLLIDYMKRTGVSAKVIAESMIANGVQVQEMTIRGWLDEDSHTIGPRNRDSIEQIALLVEDTDMFENSEKYFNACSKIRRIRREILKTIGKAIISKLSGHTPENGTLIADVFDRIDSLTNILRIETISNIKKDVPINMTNRPITIKEETYV